MPLTRPPARACERCGTPYTPATRPHGNPRRFCSARCRLLAWAARQLAEGVA